MAIFDAPGRADADAPRILIDAWNALIARELSGRPQSPILVADPAEIPNGQISSAVKWPGHPLEPLNCLDEETAAVLSDWGWPGRAELHNEYLEYTLVMRPDEEGRLRPKRFIATTELMEWWQLMAVHTPDYFLGRVHAITGLSPRFEDIFGRSVAQWNQLSVTARTREFFRVMVSRGRWMPPASDLNPRFALFMSHMINGLDDLIYVVHFGSFPYAVREGGALRRARIDEIFLNEDRTDLYCRNADPAAAEGAYNQAFMIGTENAPQARPLAFANPIGMYMRTFTSGDLFLNGVALPQSWTRWSRGAADMRQRLEFGPADGEPGFLDDVTIGREQDAPHLTGYQIAKRIEVGPLVLVGAPRAIVEADFQEIPGAEMDTVTCGLETDGRCVQIAQFKSEFDNQGTALRTGTRGGPIG
jgi:hypothetical protein